LPIYEYRCQACDSHFDELARSGTPDAEITCPSCGERRAEKKVSAFGVTGVSTGSGTSGGACVPRSGFT